MDFPQLVIGLIVFKTQALHFSKVIMILIYSVRAPFPDSREESYEILLVQNQYPSLIIHT